MSDGKPTSRAIGLLGATAVVAGSMLGVGIFLTPHLVARSVASPTLFLLLWGLGGVIAAAGAVTYAELGAMMPQAGGDYVYLDRAFGPTTGFAAGVVLFVGVFGGSIASMSAAVSQYQLRLLCGLVGIDLSRVWVDVPGTGMAFHGVEVVAVGLVVLLTVLNAIGVRLATWAQMLLTLVPFGILTVFAVAALATAPHPTAVPAAPTAIDAGAVGAALLNVYFAYAGWNAVAYVGGEVIDPGRNLPRALLLGTALVTALYLLLCAAWISVLGMGGIAEAFEVGTAAVRALAGPGADGLVAAVIAVALVGSVNATVLGGARIGYAMGRDGALSPFFGKLSERTRVPVRALCAQAAFSALLIVTGAFEQLVLLTSVAMFLLGSLTVCALFVLRRREPAAERPYRASFYPVLPAVYLVTALAVIGIEVHALIEGAGEASALPLLGVGIFALVWVVHRVLHRMTR